MPATSLNLQKHAVRPPSAGATNKSVTIMQCDRYLNRGVMLVTAIPRNNDITLCYHLLGNKPIRSDMNVVVMLVFAISTSY